MIPRRSGVALTNRVTYEEFQRLFAIRLETLEDATRVVTGGPPLPISWRGGWKAYITILRRDRDGSLCARIDVHGPQVTHRWTRKVRLVKPKELRLHYR